ncbi:MAG: cytochrome [Acidimicrobiales bacterium]|jgi:cytochrome P450|nr:cytochrome [Acidimicrobiales bacterium]
MTDLAEAYDPSEIADVFGDVRDPYPDLANARRANPVERIDFGELAMGDGDPNLPATPAHDTYTVYSHELVQRVLLDNETFSSSGYAEIMGVLMGHTILEMDEPEHRHHRGLVAQAFREKTLARWEADLVRATVDELVDNFAGAGHAELVRQFTFPFPVRVIARILGLPKEDYVKFQRWSIELISVTANWERALASSNALRDYFKPIVDQRRSDPSDDLISDLAQAELDGNTLDDEEIFAFLRLLLPAGVETTYRSTGNFLYALLTHPEQMEALRADRSLMKQAIEETLRWEPPLLFITRTAARDVELGGVAVKAGSQMGVSLGAANRDESRYRDPDTFDIFRDPGQHISFGFGPHLCLGMHLARMEMRVAADALLDRLPNLRLDPAGDDPHIHGMIFRSPNRLPVVFDS